MRQSKAKSSKEPMTIVVCKQCYQRIRLPRLKSKLHVICPVCQHKFDFQYYALGLSSESKTPLLVGLAGSIAGAILVELIAVSGLLDLAGPVLSTAMMSSVFGIIYGGVMGAAQGYLQDEQDKLYYGLKTGAITGLVSGIVSGLISHGLFSAILVSASLQSSVFQWPTLANSTPPPSQLVLARTISWSVFGFVIGLTYIIKDRTWRDAKHGATWRAIGGMIWGLIGGAVGGLFFELLGSAMPLYKGSLGRFLGLTVLGTGVGVAVYSFKKVIVHRRRRSDKPRVPKPKSYPGPTYYIPIQRSQAPHKRPELPSKPNSGPKLPPNAT